MNNYQKIIDVLNEYGIYSSKTDGFSMRPFIKSGRDTIILKKVENPPKKHDIVAYPLQNGKVCLHRIIKVKKDCYIIRGDGNIYKEKVIKEDIFAVLKGYYKDKKYIDVNKNFGYKFLSGIWLIFNPVRILLIKFKMKLKRKGN